MRDLYTGRKSIDQLPITPENIFKAIRFTPLTARQIADCLRITNPYAIPVLESVLKQHFTLEGELWHSTTSPGKRSSEFIKSISVTARESFGSDQVA